MTFSSASLSACEVDEVAAIAAGAAGLRAGVTAACWRVAGPNAGAAGATGAGAGATATGAALADPLDPLGAALVAGAAAAVVLGTTLRALGRGFGNGTFGLAQTSVAIDKVAASTRLIAKAVDKAVDRKATARTERVTAFPDGESFNEPKLYLIEYVEKMLTPPCRDRDLCANTTAKSRLARVEQDRYGPFAGT